MKSTEPEERRAAAAVAAGMQPADVILSGGRVLNVHTGLISRSDVAFAGRRIAAVGDVEYTRGSETKSEDCSGTYLVPGFIDSHIHLGGSQLTIQRLAEVVVPHGTIALSTDFYELATIGGLDAVLSELTAAQGTGLEILLSPFVAAVLGIGAFGNLERFSYDDLEVLLNHEACVELREWNCWANWLPLEGQQRIYELALSRGLAIGGHLEGLSGANLQASTALGVRSEHEAVSIGEALERLDNGVTVQIRGGSAARDFEDLVPAITERGADPRMFAFCTDEQELASIATSGHIDRLIRRAIRNGIAPIEAIRMATLNAALSMGVDRNFGSITPGRVASLVAVEDLATLPIAMVFADGRLAARSGQYLLEPSPVGFPAAARKSVVVDEPVTPADFRFDVPDGEHEVRVIGVAPGKLLTEELVERLTFTSGVIAEGDLTVIGVTDRHLGGHERALGLIRGLGLSRGAVAATVNPGMMNLLTLGANPEDMAIAARRVVELGGGIVVALDGRILAEVALPLYGIISDAPSSEVVQACLAVEKVIEEDLGCHFEGLISAAGFACLAVSIPSLKITSRGLARVSREAPAEAVTFVLE